MNAPAAVPDLAADEALMLRATREAGAIALGYFRTSVAQWDKGDDDPVSEADHAVDDYLRQHLTAARPDYGWLSEESEDDAARLARRRVWVVDPIDGTRAFLKGKPEFAVSVALVEAGEPILGAVYNPARDELFQAARGCGALLNGEAIRASRHESFEGARFLGGKWVFQRAVGVKLPRKAQFDWISSIAYRMALIAAGRHDICLSLGAKSDWDVAAADLIVREAGGCVTTARGVRLLYNAPRPRHASVVIAGPALHAEALAFLDRIELPDGKSW